MPVLEVCHVAAGNGRRECGSELRSKRMRFFDRGDASLFHGGVSRGRGAAAMKWRGTGALWRRRSPAGRAGAHPCSTLYSAGTGGRSRVAMHTLIRAHGAVAYREAPFADEDSHAAMERRRCPRDRRLYQALSTSNGTFAGGRRSTRSARHATFPASRGLHAARARHSPNAAERLCLYASPRDEMPLG